MSVVLVAGTKKGAAILKSNGRGEWLRDFVLHGWHVTASVEDDTGRVYVAVASEVFGPAIFAGGNFKDWTQLSAAPRYAPEDRGNPEHNRIAAATDFSGRYASGGRFVDQIWKLHFAHSALYAGVSEAGLFVSRNRGESWQPLKGFNDHPERESWPPGFGGLCAHTILSDAKNPNRLWAGVSAAGFFRSDDAGKTWTPKNNGVPSPSGQCVHCVAHDPTNADVMYRQEHFGVYKSENGGDSWRAIENGLPVAEMSDGSHCSFGFPIAMDRPSGSVFVAPLDGDNMRMPRGGQLAVYRTTDGGRWQAQTDGLPANCYASVLRGAMAADQESGIYFGTSSGTLYGSRDLGGHWRELASGLPRIMSVEAYVR